ncbi:MAG: hypothetical protein H7A25_19550 [Leptospiraceae bacterium]|nr:hypothetical protein [Leptospiraceae bacterium]
MMIIIFFSGDGTRSSSPQRKIHCKSCLVKNKKSGTLYQHMMYGACIVHPDKKEVIPLMFLNCYYKRRWEKQKMTVSSTPLNGLLKILEESILI